MAVKTFVKGGKWSASATWSPAGEPAAGEDVILPASSSSFELKIEKLAKCRSIKAETGFTGKVTFAEGEVLEVGNGEEPPEAIAVKLISGMTFTMNASSMINLVSTYSGALAFYPGGQLFMGIHTTQLGSWKLMEALEASTLTLTKGVFDTQGHNVITKSSLGGGSEGESTATLKLGASVVKTANFSNTLGLTIEPGTSVMELTEAIAKTTTPEFQPEGVTFNKVVWSYSGATYALTYAGYCTIGTLEMLMAGSGGLKVTTYTLSHLQSKLTITSSVTANGSSGNLVKLLATGTTPWHWINSTGSNISLNYLELSYSEAEGANSSYAGTNSVNAGNNTGWKFEAPPSGVGKLETVISLTTSVAPAPTAKGVLATQGASTVTVQPTARAKGILQASSAATAGSSIRAQANGQLATTSAATALFTAKATAKGILKTVLSASSTWTANLKGKASEAKRILLAIIEE
jgi:hypothetical protein